MRAQLGGANRIELCSGRGDGGLTPSLGLVRHARNSVLIEVWPIIRCRGGDFLYTESELAVMLDDIRSFKTMDVNGFVFGALTKDGDVDTSVMSRVIEASSPLKVSFHRAFDVCRNYPQALEVLIELGVPRVLTSGQAAKAQHGLDVISHLVSLATKKEGDGEGTRLIEIMAGSGVSLSNVKQILETGVHSVHLTATKSVPSLMLFRNPRVSMSGKIPTAAADKKVFGDTSGDADEYTNFLADQNVIEQIAAIISLM